MSNQNELVPGQKLTAIAYDAIIEEYFVVNGVVAIVETPQGPFYALEDTLLIFETGQIHEGDQFLLSPVGGLTTEQLADFEETIKENKEKENTTTMTTPTAEITNVANDVMTPLTAADRCDRCGAQAYYRVILLKSLGELTFCKHHWDKNSDALQEQSAYVQDESHKLLN